MWDGMIDGPKQSVSAGLRAWNSPSHWSSDRRIAGGCNEIATFLALSARRASFPNAHNASGVSVVQKYRRHFGLKDRQQPSQRSAAGLGRLGDRAAQRGQGHGPVVRAMAENTATEESRHAG